MNTKNMIKKRFAVGKVDPVNKTISFIVGKTASGRHKFAEVEVERACKFRGTPTAFQKMLKDIPGGFTWRVDEPLKRASRKVLAELETVSEETVRYFEEAAREELANTNIDYLREELESYQELAAEDNDPEDRKFWENKVAHYQTRLDRALALYGVTTD